MFKKDKTLRKDMMQQWKASLPPPLFAPAPSPGMELPHPGVPTQRERALWNSCTRASKIWFRNSSVNPNRKPHELSSWRRRTSCTN